MNGRNFLIADDLIGKIAVITLALAVALAPALGGYPTGAEYGQDTALNALRCLILIASLCFAILPIFSSTIPSGKIGNAAPIAAWVTLGLSVLSLLVHSRFLTSPVLLFAMLPATLDWLSYTLVFTFAMLFARQRGGILILFFALVTGGLWGAIQSLWGSAWDWKFMQFVQNEMRGQRLQGVFFSPNFAGGFFGLMLPIVAAGCIAARDRFGAFVLGTTGALMAGALVATGSRAGIALAVVGLVVSLILASITTRGRLPWGRVAILGVAVIALGFAFRGPLTTRVEEGGTQENSGKFREWTWKGTVVMAKAHPILGTGPGTFPYLYPRYSLVARTDLAHSSYLQLAAEQGFPALAATVATIVLAGGAGILALFRPTTATKSDDADDIQTRRLLLCGLVGGLLVGAARSVFDSEWSLLGNGIPFWAVAGLCAGLQLTFTPPTTTPSKTSVLWRGGAALGLVAALVFSLLLLREVGPRDSVQEALRQRQPTSPPPIGWPPDPTVLSLNNEREQAAQVEPSGKRLYQLGRDFERAGDLPRAIEVMKQSVEADPTKMQTWRKLAEIQEQAGRKTDALESWRQITVLQEGPVGLFRAIPELPETHPAFAYAALADATLKDAKQDDAKAIYKKAAAVVELYSQTKPLYQQMEVITAQTSGVDVMARREEVQKLYQHIMDALSTLDPSRKTELTQRRDDTLERLRKFTAPDTSP